MLNPITYMMRTRFRKGNGRGDADIDQKECAFITINEDVGELEELAESAGYRIQYEIIQRRERPEPSTFIGKGKIEEIKRFLQENLVNAIIINGDLRPSQHYMLENTFKIECIDRIGLVLNIFTSRANSKESKLQVERARLQYEIPLLREWIHSAKMGEHPGFLGGGEYAVDVYYDLIKKRMKKIDEDLKGLNESNRLRRTNRKNRGLRLISLAGYTNAGKSSLLKSLTGENAIIEERMFSTLSTITRKIDCLSSSILITDTIGFYSDLPPFVIEAFKNTIEEIYTADLVLLVVDCSESKTVIEGKIRTAMDVLYPEVLPEHTILVLNKMDLMTEEMDVDWIRNLIQVREVVFVSALTNQGIGNLTSTIASFFSYPNTFEILLPQSGGTESLISQVRRMIEISTVEYGNKVRITGSCADMEMGRISKLVKEHGGTIRITNPAEKAIRPTDS